MIPNFGVTQSKTKRLAAEKRNHPTNRPNEMEPGDARPVHAARPGGLGNASWQDVLEYLFSRPPQDHLFCGEVFPFGSRNSGQHSDRQVHLLRETFGGSRRFSCGVIGNRLRRACDLLRFVRLFDAESGTRRDQPARRAVYLNARVLHQVVGGQIFFKYYFQFFHRPRQHARRDFLAPDFKQEVGCPVKLHRATSAIAAALRVSACWARKSVATRQAIWRMRPINRARSVVEMTPRESSRLKR